MGAMKITKPCKMPGRKKFDKTLTDSDTDLGKS